MEDVTITRKETETYASTTLSMAENYFFYYSHDGQRMEVPRHIYQEYGVGSQIPAYTTDHIHYGYDRDAVLPRDEFRNNEIMKCVGVLLGAGICCLALFRGLSR